MKTGNGNTPVHTEKCTAAHAAANHRSDLFLGLIDTKRHKQVKIGRRIGLHGDIKSVHDILSFRQVPQYIPRFSTLP